MISAHQSNMMSAQQSNLMPQPTIHHRNFLQHESRGFGISEQGFFPQQTGVFIQPFDS
jgi:hypothetical protein